MKVGNDSSLSLSLFLSIFISFGCLYLYYTANNFLSLYNTPLKYSFASLSLCFKSISNTFLTLYASCLSESFLSLCV